MVGKCRAELENRGSLNYSTKMSSQMLRWPGQGMTTFPAHPLLLTLKPSALGSSQTGTITPICHIGKGRVGNAEKPAHNHTETKQGKLWAYDTCHAPAAISGWEFGYGQGEAPQTAGGHTETQQSPGQESARRCASLINPSSETKEQARPSPHPCVLPAGTHR